MGDRRRPEPHRAAVAADVLVRVCASAGPDAGRGDERHRDGLLGHRRQGRRPADQRPARRARARADPHLHVPVSDGRPTRRLLRPDSGRRPGVVRGLARVHCGQVRSGGAIHGLRRTPAEPRRHRTFRGDHRSDPRGGGPVPTCCSAPTASSLPPGRFGSRDSCSSSTRCGSRSRHSPTSPRRWRGSRARQRSRWRPASG